MYNQFPSSVPLTLNRFGTTAKTDGNGNWQQNVGSERQSTAPGRGVADLAESEDRWEELLMPVIISLMRFLRSLALVASIGKGSSGRILFGEMGGSGASISSPVMLLAGYPYATLKMGLPFLFPPAVEFEDLPRHF
jgi:hypothetical protein